MRKTKYQTWITVEDGLFLYFNSCNGAFLLLNPDKHALYQSTDADELAKIAPDLYETMVVNSFIVIDEYNELDIVEFKKLMLKTDQSLYHIVVNTTLDCNLRCYYCYETRVRNSHIGADVLSAIKKNIEGHYLKHPYKTLKLSFFGGEPFLNFNAIKDLLSYAKLFCEERDLKLIADFTTNSTLITNSHIEFLKDFKCHFQITLDGHRDKHNAIKRSPAEDCYEKAIDAIRQISFGISSSKTWIRVNYDGETLGSIDKILSDIADLDRKRNFLIFRKVWQQESASVPPKMLIGALNSAISMGFFVDCYALSRHNVCFAERINQMLVNYDGKVFKCSTIPSFDDNFSLGTMSLHSGEVSWDFNKVCHITKCIRQKECEDCVLYPSCFGPCNKNRIKGDKRNCILDELNLGLREFIMYNFKLHLLDTHGNQ